MTPDASYLQQKVPAFCGSTPCSQEAATWARWIPSTPTHSIYLRLIFVVLKINQKRAVCQPVGLPLSVRPPESFIFSAVRVYQRKVGDYFFTDLLATRWRVSILSWDRGLDQLPEQWHGQIVKFYKVLNASIWPQHFIHCHDIKKNMPLINMTCRRKIFCKIMEQTCLNCGDNQSHGLEHPSALQLANYFCSCNISWVGTADTISPPTFVSAASLIADLAVIIITALFCVWSRRLPWFHLDLSL